MWSSSRAVRLIAVVFALALPLALAGCSGFRPVYGENGLGGERIALIYAEPTNRLEQLIYQDLKLRLGKADPGVAAPVLKVSTTQGAGFTTDDTVTSANSEKQISVTAKISLVDTTGATVFSASRTQTAEYTTGNSALANQRAAQKAAEDAALLLADTIRLSVLGALLR